MAIYGLSTKGFLNASMHTHRSDGQVHCLTAWLLASAVLHAFLSSSPERGERCDFALVWDPMSAKDLANAPRYYIL